MRIRTCLGTAGIAVLLTSGLALPAATAETGEAVLKGTDNKDIGKAELTQTPAGVLIKLSVKGLPPGEHAFHIHAAGKCEPPSFETAGGHFNPGVHKHGMMSGQGHAGDMPNIYIPQSGALTIELVNDKVTLDKGKPNSLFHPGGTSLVIHAQKDDYKSDPAGNAGKRIACGVITEAASATTGNAPRR
jgi:Cu-Zn family superoxide dismutase